MKQLKLMMTIFCCLFIATYSFTQKVQTVAGFSATSGFSGERRAATAAMIHQPRYLALDNAGNLYFSDYGNLPIRKINTSGSVSTVASGGSISSAFGDGGVFSTIYC